MTKPIDLEPALEAAIVTAMKQSFRDVIAGSSGKLFEDTGVTMPGDHVWERYAKAVLAVIPARSALGAAEPVAWRYRDFADGWIYTTEINREYVEMTGVALEPLYAAPLDDAELLEATEAEVKRMLAPQAVAPAEEIAGLVEWLTKPSRMRHRHTGQLTDKSPPAVQIEAARALTSLSAIAEERRSMSLEWKNACERSEAEASDLRRKLEEAEAARPANDAILQATIRRAEAAERKLEEYRKALEPFYTVAKALPDPRLINDEAPGVMDAHMPAFGAAVGNLTLGDFRRVFWLVESQNG